MSIMASVLEAFTRRHRDLFPKIRMDALEGEDGELHAPLKTPGDTYTACHMLCLTP